MKKTALLLTAIVLVVNLLFGFGTPTRSQAANGETGKVSTLLARQVESKLKSQTSQDGLSFSVATVTEEYLLLPESDVMELGSYDTQEICIYYDSEPDAVQLAELAAIGVTVYAEYWVPPVGNHPRGFILAKMPITALDQVAAIQSIRKLDTAERQSVPQNDVAFDAIYADILTNSGYDGSGVTVAVLDSGLDLSHPDIPTPIAFKDYSNAPSLDNTIANSITGHGTHVTGSVLGQGTQSGGVYSGMAPGAGLVFLKIGNDTTAGASTGAIVAAITDAVDVYHVDIITMSYGGWDQFHDGSSPEAQAVDYAVSQGVPVFISAGNYGSSDDHYSGTVAAGSTTDFIAVNITSSSSILYTNLVWYDGSSHNALTVQYYNPAQQPLVTFEDPQQESSRGTEARESAVFQNGNFVLLGVGIYYIKITNQSVSAQDFHLYNMGSGYFVDADTAYTIGAPADADSAIAVGSLTTRRVWTDYMNRSWQYPNDLEGFISGFSSRGPRVDTTEISKVNIVSPGAGIISLRDTVVYPFPADNNLYIDNDGINNGLGPADYYLSQGTSMACPIAAGAAALLLQKNPGYTPAQVKHMLEAYATDGGTAGYDPDYGWGFLNIQAAAEASLPPLNSYSDVGHLTGSDGFNYGDTVYVNAVGMHPGYNYRITWYDGSGNEITQNDVAADGSGNLGGQFTLIEGSGNTGVWNAVISEGWCQPPARIDADWAYTITTDYFLVGATLPLVTTLGVDGLEYSVATVNGNLDTLGTFTSANVSFEWGTVSGALDQETSPQLMTATGGFNTLISGLTSETTYYYRAKAAVGPAVNYGSESSFMTPAPSSFAVTRLNETVSATTGLVVVQVFIDDIIKSSDNTTVLLDGGLGSYSGFITLPDGGMDILAVEGTAETGPLAYDPGTGVFTVTNVAVPMQPSNTVIAEIVVRLTGNNTAEHLLLVDMTSIRAVNDPLVNIAEAASNGIVFLRGDASEDQVIGIGDALFISQYLVGQKTAEDIGVVNGGCIDHDNGGDYIGVGDALFVSQYLVGQKNAYFE